MARDDLNRRRLRGLYERNKRRVTALADARDRRRGGDSDVYAPRRYIVSEHRSRIEGFGRGGVQVRQVTRRITRLPPRQMFRSQAIFRRSNRDRFRRYDDEEREIMRDRFQDNRRGGGRGPMSTERGRFKRAARSRLRPRRRQDQRQTKGRGIANNPDGQNQRRGRPAREKVPTREQLDAQLDRFRAN